MSNFESSLEHLSPEAKAELLTAVEAYRRALDSNLSFVKRQRNKEVYEKYISLGQFGTNKKLLNIALNLDWHGDDYVNPREHEFNTSISLPNEESIVPDALKIVDSKNLNGISNFKFVDTDKDIEPTPKPKPKRLTPQGVMGKEVGITLTKADRAVAELLGTYDREALLLRMRALMNSKFSTVDSSIRNGRTRFAPNDKDVIDTEYFLNWYNRFLSDEVPDPKFNHMNGFITLRNFSGFPKQVIYYGNGRAGFKNGVKSVILNSDRIANYKQGGMIRKFEGGGKASQEQIFRAFTLDLGLVLGALDQKTALLKGSGAIQKMGQETTTLLFLIWGEAESQQEGAGKKALVQVLSQSLESMGENMNGAPSAAVARNGRKLLCLSELNGHCPAGFEVEKYLVGGCVKCKRKKLLALTEELKCGGKKRINKAQKGDELPELKCGGKGRVKKHDDGGVFSWLKDLLASKPTTQQTYTVTTSVPASSQYTTDTKHGVNRLTQNTSGEGYVDGSFFEGYRGLNGSWADIDWPAGQGKGKKRIVTESAPGVADSLSYRYFNRPIPTRK